MKPSVIIKSLVAIREDTIQSIVSALGKNSGAAISNAIYRETRMKIETLKEILDVLDAEIVIRTKDGKHEWVICDEDDSE